MSTTAEYTLSAVIITCAHWEEGPHILAWKKEREAEDTLFLCYENQKFDYSTALMAAFWTFGVK